MFTLGYCYDAGQGVPRNRRLAEAWYRRAARRGVSMAAANLARMRAEQGDTRGELKWLRRAAKVGDEEAQLLLAERERSGRHSSFRELALAAARPRTAIRSRAMEKLGRLGGLRVVSLLVRGLRDSVSKCAM